MDIQEEMRVYLTTLDRIENSFALIAAINPNADGPVERAKSDVRRAIAELRLTCADHSRTDTECQPP
jgi:hypothetical protein